MTKDHTVLPATVDYRQYDYCELCSLFDEVFPDYEAVTFPSETAPSDGSVVGGTIVYALEDVEHENAYAAIIENFERHGVAKRRLATFSEMLAFSRRYPDLQRKYRIAVPGGLIVVDGDPCVPLLEGDGKKRVLSLVYSRDTSLHCDRILTVVL